MFYPITRLRRLRLNKNIRNLFSETKINLDDLIYPMFIIPGKSRTEKIQSMPGI